MQHHDRAMVDGEAAEAALELVAIGDRGQALRPRRLIGRQEAKGRRPLAGPASLGVAGAHEEPVRPGVKARRVAELRKVSPDAQQRLLRRILGEVDIAQDPVRHRVEPVAARDGEAREGLLVAVLRPDHECGIHVPFRAMRRHGLGAVNGYGQAIRRDDSMFAADVAISSSAMATIELPPDLADLPRWGFADPGPLREELTALAIAGTKTTTAGLLVELELDGESSPGRAIARS